MKMHRTSLGLKISSLILLVASGCGSDGSAQGPVPQGDAGTDVLEASPEDAQPDRDAAAPESGHDAANDAEIDPRFRALATAIEKERIALGAPGVAVAVLEGGEVTFARGFGSKDPDDDVPVETTTLFRIGSVTKMLTATAVLQLVASGDVALDAPLTSVLAGYAFARDASWAPSITVRHLLTHQSGMVDYLEVDDSPVSEDDLNAFLYGPFAQSAYLMAPPGRMYNYTNPGFMLAGLVAEKVSGVRYKTLLHDRVLEPLGMHRTLFRPSDVLGDGDYALGETRHWQTGQRLVVHPDTYDNGWGAPAGYAFSSVLDLATFVQFLRAGDESVLSDSLREEMQKPQVSTKEFLDRSGYGYGTLVQQGIFLGTSFYDIELVAHGGAIPGFAADLYYVPACDLGFISLSNTDGAYYTNGLVTALTTLCELPEPATPPSLVVDPATYDRFVGTFIDPNNVGTVEVTHEGNDLRVKMPLVDEANLPYEPTLQPYLPDNFLLSIQGTELLVTFLFDEAGKVEYFRTRSFVAAVAESQGGVSPSQPLLVTKGKNALLESLRAAHPTRLPPLVPRRQ